MKPASSRFRTSKHCVLIFRRHTMKYAVHELSLANCKNVLINTISPELSDPISSPTLNEKHGKSDLCNLLERKRHYRYISARVALLTRTPLRIIYNPEALQKCHRLLALPSSLLFLNSAAFAAIRSTNT